MHLLGLSISFQVLPCRERGDPEASTSYSAGCSSTPSVTHCSPRTRLKLTAHSGTQFLQVFRPQTSPQSVHIENAFFTSNFQINFSRCRSQLSQRAVTPPIGVTALRMRWLPLKSTLVVTTGKNRFQMFVCKIMTVEPKSRTRNRWRAQECADEWHL